MEFRLNIHADSAAFDSDPRPEIARILRELAQRTEDGWALDTFRTVFDENGNDVGRVALKEHF